MEMIKFNEQEKIDSVNGALALRPQINEIVDEICERGYSNICWLVLVVLGQVLCRLQYI